MINPLAVIALLPFIIIVLAIIGSSIADDPVTFSEALSAGILFVLIAAFLLGLVFVTIWGFENLII